MGQTVPPTVSSIAPAAGVPRLARLDGLRGLAACGVAFGYHAANHFLPGPIARTPLLLPFAWLQQWGWTMVDLFFVLSGFIFAHVYLTADALRRPGALGDFAMARLARLYPLHLLLLFAVAMIETANPNNTLGAFVAHLLMVQALWPPVAQSFVGPTWSISVEVFCYALFARTAAAGNRSLALAGGLAMAWALATLLVHGQPGGPWSGDDFPRGFLGFFLGVALWRQRSALARLPWPVLAGILILGLMIDMGAMSSVLPLSLLAWPAALLLALRLPLLESRTMLWLGDRSYAIYLIHLPVINLLLRRFDSSPAGLAEPLLAITLATGITLLLAELSFRWIEQPARRRMRLWWDARRVQRGSPAVT
ncbi:MAG: acyltransferase [Sphingomonadales bacterium]|nr:acyltransferase [Sphingomonadales bacterium]